MKILLIDDHVLFREGVAGLINAQPDLTIIGSGESVADAIKLSRQLKPDLILMDFSLPDGTGLEATCTILSQQPEANIIFLTMHEDDERLFNAVRCGAKGYLLKNVPVSRLISYIRGVARGEAAITRTMTSRLMKKITSTELNPTTPPSELDSLTTREMEVLRELQTGDTNREIADRLIITERTVKNHVSNILAKLGLRNRYEAANYARRHGVNS